MKLELVNDRSLEYLENVCNHFFEEKKVEFVPLFQKLKVLFFIYQAQKIIGFINLKRVEGTIFIPIYLKNDLESDDYKSLMCLLKELLDKDPFLYLVLINRNPEIALINRLSPFVEYENSSVTYKKKDNDITYSIKKDAYLWSTEILSADLLTPLFLKCFAYEKEYVMGQWDYLIDDYLDKDEPKQIFSCFDHDRLIACLLAVEHETYTYIYGICTDPEYTEKGIGEKLMRLFLNENLGHVISLQVYTENKSALRLYEKLNFLQFSIDCLVAKGFKS